LRQHHDALLGSPNILSFSIASTARAFWVLLGTLGQDWSWQM